MKNKDVLLNKRIIKNKHIWKHNKNMNNYENKKQ